MADQKNNLPAQPAPEPTVPNLTAQLASLSAAGSFVELLAG